MKVAFIGGGRMAEALIKGLLTAKLTAPSDLKVSDSDLDRREHLKKTYLISTYEDNQSAASLAEVVILAVKPQVLPEVVAKLALRPDQLLISLAAGITLGYLQKKFPAVPVVRTMPNNPALAQAGITALVAGGKVKEPGLKLAKKIFGVVGEVVEVDEKHMDAVTGLSGSGPAFIYLVIEALIEAGVELGLDELTASKLATQTVLGSAKTMIGSQRSARELREMVTSPGGTTIEGLAELEKGGVKKSFRSAVIAAARKAKALSAI